MQESSVILACVLVFSSIGSPKAQPLDSPSATAAQQSPKALANPAIGVHEAGSNPATSARAAKQSAPKFLDRPKEKITDGRATGTAVTTSDTTSAKGADALRGFGIAATFRPRSTPQQVTAAMAARKEPKQKTNSTADGSDAVLHRDSETTEPALSNHTDPRIAIVMARPEIRSMSDLAGKNVAIGAKQSASGGVVQIALAAAGATGVRLAESSTKALDRVIDGEVPAAVLMLAYPEAAEAFPEIAGFNIFRIPLTPERSRVTKALSTPANTTAAADSARAKIVDPGPTGAIATGSHTRTTQELVTAAIAVAERMTNPAADSQAIAPAPANGADPRFAILMARSDIKSLSDLAGKKIAIDEKQASSSNVLATITAVADVQVSEGQKKAIDRVIGGELPAAVLILVSLEAAQAFPEIPGFKIFRIPVTPEMPSAKIVDSQPAGKGASAADTAGAKIATLPNGSSSASVSHPIKSSSQPIDLGPSEDLDKVIADLDRTIQRTPEDAQAYRNRGNAWGRKGDMDRALADYEQAIRLHPEDPVIFRDRGLMWQHKGEFDKAIVDFDRAVRMSFSDPELYSDRGAAWFEKGSYDRALADFNQALKINPALATAYVRRAVIFERKGDQERARADREQAIRLGGPTLTQSDGRSGEGRDQ